MRHELIRIVLSLATCASPAAAQTVSWLRTTAGMEQSAQRNPGESPYAYSGWGPALTLGYGRDTPRTAFDFSLGGGYATLHSSAAPGDATHGTLVVSSRYLRALGTPHLGARWMLGAELASVTEATDHKYVSRTTEDVFAYWNVSAGPAVRASWKRRGATITNELTVPLVNVVDFPYSNAKSDGLAVRFHVASPATLQSFDDAIGYRVGRDDAPSATWTYRLTYLRYTFVEARRFARQSMSVTFNFPLRRRPAAP